MSARKPTPAQLGVLREVASGRIEGSADGKPYRYGLPSGRLPGQIAALEAAGLVELGRAAFPGRPYDPRVYRLTEAGAQLLTTEDQS